MSDYCAILLVDDTDLLCMSLSAEEYPRQTLEPVQRSFTDWANGLRVTGGVLKPDNLKKCVCYLVTYKWKDGMCSYVDPDENLYNIVVEDSAGLSHTISTKGADAA